MLAPFMLHVAKFSKRLNKEPKEDFQILSGINKLRPSIKETVSVEVYLTEAQLKQGQAGLLEALENDQIIRSEED